MRFRKVLIALDGSARAEQSLRVVPPLTAPGAELCLLRVAPNESGRAEAEAYLRALVGRMLRWEGSPAEVSEMVGVGDPARVILKVADEERVDITAVATHGHAGALRLLNGSVAESVVRSSLKPVLIIRSPGGDRPPDSDVPPPAPDGAIQNLVVPVDGTPKSEAVLPYAELIATRHGARLHLVRAIAGSLQSSSGAAAVEAVHHLARRLRVRGLKALVHVVTGAPTPTILEVADEVDADLIAMSTHGRSGLFRLALGSTAEHVIRRAEAPVFLVRAAAVATAKQPDMLPDPAPSGS